MDGFDGYTEYEKIIDDINMGQIPYERTTIESLEILYAYGFCSRCDADKQVVNLMKEVQI